MKPELSQEQREVVESRAPRFVVTAAAGAGKTFVLVERYLRHVVDEGLRPDQILTITFTKKAAYEMKRRIVNALRAAGLTDAAQIAETGPIQTIHSFCERLLRENALEAGLDPAFEILGEAQASRLAVACIRDTLASDLGDLPEAERLIASLTGRRQNPRESRSPYSALETAIEDVLDELRGSGQIYEQVRDRHHDPEALRRQWETHLTSQLDGDIQEAMRFVDADNLHERIQRAAKATEKKAPVWAKGKVDWDAEMEALSHTCGLVQLACDAWARLHAEMGRLQQLDFSELENRAVRLLASSPATRERLKKQYRVAMVDEAQDLNPMQYRLLELLGIEREMLVGDSQQSIYGFRQTDVQLFTDHLARTTTLPLSKNYRSDEGILSFVDLLFSRLWQSYEPMNRPSGFDLDNVISIDCSGVELWQQEASDVQVTAAYVRELIDEGVPANEIAILVRHTKFAIDLKARLNQIGVESRISGGSERFYARLEIRDVANALRAVADPYDDFALLACLRSPVAGLSLDSIVLLGQAPGIVERLTSFEPPVVEDTAKLDTFLKWYLPLKGVADRLSAWEVISEVFARSPYLENVARRPGADQQLANVRKLLTLAAREPELGPLEYAERIREIQDIRHREGDAPAGADDDKTVKLMTIHKAKGLEFPVVVVPQTDRRLDPKPRDLLIDTRLALVATKFGKVPSMMHRYLTERRKQREEAEELRVLYVALTRAKSRLCVCMYPARGNRTLSKVITDAIGQTPPPGVRVRSERSE